MPTGLMYINHLRALLSILGLRRYVWTTDFDGAVRLAMTKRGGPTGWMCRKIWGWVAMLPDHTFEGGTYVQKWVPFQKGEVFDKWIVDSRETRAGR